MPRQKRTSVVDRECLVDVCRNKVIESGLGAGDEVGGSASRLGLEALHSLDVVESFLFTERAPEVSLANSHPKTE